jgi:hypothetical protein
MKAAIIPLIAAAHFNTSIQLSIAAQRAGLPFVFACN